MMIDDSTPAGNPWTCEVRRQAWIAVSIAASRRVVSRRVLAYYVRSALAHGLCVEEVCQAGNLSPDEVLEMSEPAAA